MLSREQKLELVENMLQNHTVLQPDMFSPDELLRPEVRDKLLGVSDYVTQKIMAMLPSARIDDIVLLGSICSYAYSASSDVDLFIFVDNVLPDPNQAAWLLDWINQWIATLKCLPVVFGHRVDCGILLVNNSRHSGHNFYSVQKNCWIDKPVRMEYPFSAEELFQSYCQYSAELHHFVAGLEKVNNAFLTRESSFRLRVYLKELRDKAYESRDHSSLREYSLEYNLYRLLKRFGTYKHFEQYARDSLKNLIRKKE